jgi:flavodoxin
MTKVLVAYFSASGVTKRLATTLAQATGGDLFEIVPREPYTKSDLNWMNPLSRGSVEMKNRASRPEIASTVEDMSSYDAIFVGFPVWWYTAPTIINTFIEAHDLSGKTLCVFATSGGSNVSGSAADLKKAYPQYTWGESRLMN